MDNGTFVTAGLVLRETETKESDKILTVLTPELGRISVIAKGARSRRSKYTAACQLLAYDEMTLRRKGEWYYLAEANTGEGLKMSPRLKPYFQFVLPVLILVILVVGLLPKG